MVLGLLRFVPGLTIVLHRPHRGEVHPPPHDGWPTLADLQLALIPAAAALLQVQTHRFAVRGATRITPRVAQRNPQHAGRGFTDGAGLTLDHLILQRKFRQFLARLLALAVGPQR